MRDRPKHALLLTGLLVLLLLCTFLVISAFAQNGEPGSMSSQEMILSIVGAYAAIETGKVGWHRFRQRNGERPPTRVDFVRLEGTIEAMQKSLESGAGKFDKLFDRMEALALQFVKLEEKHKRNHP